MTPKIGYALHDENRPILTDSAIDAVEITFERADDPLRVERYLGDMEFEHVSIHALKLSVASPEPPRKQYLEALKAIAGENGASGISDHLGFTHDRNSGIELGHFAPPPYTQEALDATCRNVEVIQRNFGSVPFYVENIAYLFRFPGTLTEAEFLARLLDRTGCGLLLDVTNAHANAHNFGDDARAFIDLVVPRAARVEIHLAGGYVDEESNEYIDSHSEPIEEEVWELYRHALTLGRGKVDAVIIERDQNFPDEEGWRAEVRTARRIADEVAHS